ncbi:MAG TPA: protein kinase [Pirellulales bacterium]|nr:protein kinase [Pirellulales bacterium]
MPDDPGHPERTLRQSDDDLRRASERSMQPSRPPLEVPGYKSERFLGAGAYGQVWVAVDENTGRRVAIKFYAHRGGLDWTLLSREVERLAMLFADRYVVQLVEVGWDSDPPYFVMEYLESGSLADRLAAGPLPVAEAVDLLREVAIGLVHAHGKGILHCDLKPANVLLDQDGRPRLADFGQSRLSHEQSPSLGTLFYMAPEQADLQAMPDARWDVYALGALLYAMLTGGPPYRDERAIERIQQASGLAEQLGQYRDWIERSPVPRAHRRVRGVDRELADIISRCLAVDPHKRYANPQTVVDALMARRTRRARRPLLVLGAVGPLLLLLVMSVFGWDVFETALHESSDALTRRALESDRFAAQFVAETVAREIDRRWQILEHAVAEPRFRRLVADAGRRPPEAAAEDAMQTLLEEIDHQNPISQTDSWFVLDARGIQLARSPMQRDTIGVDYSFRDYFHGKGHDLPRGDRPPSPITAPYLSIVFDSEATHLRTVVLSVPIWSDDESAGGRTVIGVVGHGVALGHFAELRADEMSGNNQVAVLIDGRPDATGRAGAILEHPDLKPLLDDPVTPVSRLYLTGDVLSDLARLRNLRLERRTDPLEAQQANELAWIEDYRDPVGGEYAGRWLAAIEPVEINVRPEASRDTGWAVIVQERYAAAIEPVEQLRDRLFWRAKLALAVVLLVVSATWAFVIVVLNESSRPGWLDRLRRRAGVQPSTNTPDSTGYSASLSGGRPE